MKSGAHIALLAFFALAAASSNAEIRELAPVTPSERSQPATGDRAPAVFAAVRMTDFRPASSGTWTSNAKGRTWTLTVAVEGATDINLGLRDVDLPDGVTIDVFSDHGGKTVRFGPYRAHDVFRGQLWIPVLPGSRATIEMMVPDRVARDPDFVIHRVNAGILDFWSPESALRKGFFNCGPDAICDEADAFRDNVRSAALYLIEGSTWCSGTLVNDVSRSGTPYLLTATHCGVTQENAPSVISYFNFAAPICNLQTGGRADQFIAGATLRMSEVLTDVALLELVEAPPAEYEAYWSGWDRSDAAVPAGYGIHHPQFQVKKLALKNGEIPTAPDCTIPDATDLTHLLVEDWDQGVTQPGSSGSGLWNTANNRLVGTLTGGNQICGPGSISCYGKVAAAWDGASPGQRLRDWLDPNDLAPDGIDGYDPHAKLVLDSVTSLDNCAASGSDGISEPGEELQLIINLRAQGDDFSGIIGRIIDGPELSPVSQSRTAWPDMERGEVAGSLQDIVLSTSPFVGCTIPPGALTLRVASDQGVFDIPIELKLGNNLDPTPDEVEIPDGGRDFNPARSVIEIQSQATVNSVVVKVDIEHTWITDLVVTLLTPSGDRIRLIDRIGQSINAISCNNNNVRVTFDDASSISPDDLARMCTYNTNDDFPGTQAQPVDPLSVVAGTPAAGQWILIVEDWFSDDGGIVKNWELVFDPPIASECDACLDHPEFIFQSGYEGGADGRTSNP